MDKNEIKGLINDLSFIKDSTCNDCINEYGKCIADGLEMKCTMFKIDECIKTLNNIVEVK